MKEIRFIAIPDCHIPYEDKRALSTALKVLEWYQPDETIILGDFLDMACISHWLKDRNRTKEGLRLADDYNAGNKILDVIQASSKRVIYIQGNHDGTWVEDAIEKNPELDGLINLEIGLKFKQRRIKTFKYGECYNLGKLYFTHGCYTGQNHAKKHVESYGRSIVYGHLHDVQLHTTVSPIDIEDKHIGLSLGCLAKKNPDFMKNRPNNWVHCVGVGLSRPDGSFSIDPVMICNGVASYGGMTFKG